MFNIITNMNISFFIKSCINLVNIYRILFKNFTCYCFVVLVFILGIFVFGSCLGNLWYNPGKAYEI